jgi:hypothetical protein
MIDLMILARDILLVEQLTRVIDRLLLLRTRRIRRNPNSREREKDCHDIQGERRPHRVSGTYDEANESDCDGDAVEIVLRLVVLGTNTGALTA